MKAKERALDSPEWADAAIVYCLFGLSPYRLNQIEDELEVVRMGKDGRGHKLYKVDSIRAYLEKRARDS